MAYTILANLSAGNQPLSIIDGNFALAAPLASPTFTGTPAAPTATPGTNTTQIATTAFVTNAVSGSNGIVRAWVNWTGGGTTINASSNVTSITRNSTGNYTVTFTNAISATAAFMPSYLDNSQTGGIKMVSQGTTTAVVQSYGINGTAVDFTTYSLVMIA